VIDLRSALEARIHIVDAGSFGPDVGATLDELVHMQWTPSVRARVVATVEANVRRERPDVGTLFVLAEMDPATRNVSVNAWDPRYQHGCDRCRFLGRFVDTSPPQAEEFDLYVCDKQLTGRTFIARYGVDQPQYASGRMPGMMPALDEAQRRFYAMDMDRP